jgi:hypothetical protein
MTNPTTTQAWTDVADRFAALALKLKLHAEEELAERGVDVGTLADDLGRAVSGAADALADAVHDDAIRQDLRDAGASFRDALRSCRPTT